MYLCRQEIQIKQEKKYSSVFLYLTKPNKILNLIRERGKNIANYIQRNLLFSLIRLVKYLTLH